MLLTNFDNTMAKPRKIPKEQKPIIIPESELMTLEDIKKNLEDKRLYVVAKKTGLTYPTIRKLAMGTGKNYTYDTMCRITKYFKPDFSDYELKSI